ncbi:MAG: hypothetical protein LBH21_04200, partial [Gracilibacteraceae bacterium]|nr:hypothetical protein [Gracilibacteraceae bacterium]
NYLRSTAASNWGGFSSKEFDALVEEARKVADENERRDLYVRAAAINNAEVMHNVLVYQGYVAMYGKKIQGFIPQARGSVRGFRDVSIVE